MMIFAVRVNNNVWTLGFDSICDDQNGRRGCVLFCFVLLLVLFVCFVVSCEKEKQKQKRVQR